MHLTVERAAVSKLMKHLRKMRPFKGKSDSTVRLWACEAHVFVESNGVIAGTEALVLQDGTCHVGRNMFLKLIQSFNDRPNVTLLANERTLSIENVTFTHMGYSPEAMPPSGFNAKATDDDGAQSSLI